MGQRGPVPKRASQRRRRNKDGGDAATATAAQLVVWPDPNEDWHPIARDWYLSLERSGQCAFYEPSDVVTAQYIAEAMSRNLTQAKFSSMLFAAVMSGMTELLTTEGARRRARVELERSPDESVVPPEVAIMAEYRRAAGK